MPFKLLLEIKQKKKNNTLFNQVFLEKTKMQIKNIFTKVEFSKQGLSLVSTLLTSNIGQLPSSRWSLRKAEAS